MQQPQVVASFWMCLKESGLLTPEQLAAVRRDPVTRNLSFDEAAEHLIEQGLLTRFQVDRLLEGRSRGFFFDHYKIRDILGVGGMGWVYQAEDTRDGREVALKVLQDQLKRDDGMHARFLQEGRMGIRLVHPNIVRTYELGAAGGLPYIIMDFVRGPSLLEVLLRLKRLPSYAACEIARQAALGLEHAHSLGIVHRDVKPQNLLLDATGRVRLLDFGLAMAKEGETGDEFSMAMIFGHSCVGTAEYAAPEQTENSLAADARSDVYSLGAALFTALTGQTPFRGKTTAEMLRAHRVEPLRSVRELVPSIPAEVDAIVQKMMAKDPALRFPTARSVADALAPWAKQVPLEFDFEEILAERQAHAQRKLAQISEARHTGSGIANSTARPTRESSVASASSGKLDHSSVTSKPEVRMRDTDAVKVPADATVASSAISSPISLGVLVSIKTNEKFPLTRDRLIVGRSREADLRVDDAAVSGRHCELRHDGYHWWITDLGSRNGTQVKGASIQQPHELHWGDEFLIGSRILFRLASSLDEDASTSTGPMSGFPGWMWIAVLSGLAVLGGAIAALFRAF